MKIASKTIESFLEKPAVQCRAVLVYGPDQGLVRERARRIREAVLGKDYDSFAYVEIEEARLLDDPPRLSDELRAIHMMAPRRVIGLRGGDKLARIIEGAAEDLSENAFLVVEADELGPRSGLRVLFEQDPSLAAVACYRDEVRDVQGVIRKKFAEAGLQADSNVIDYLASQLGNDRYVTYQELDKIILFSRENKNLSLEDARQLVDYNRETSSDDIVQAVADRNLVSLEQFLQVQLREGAQPVMYLRALQRYFNRLYSIRAQLAEGKELGEILSSLKPKVFFKQEQSLRRHVQSWDLPQITRALALLVNAELACKTSDLPAVAASSRRLFQVTQLR